MLSAPCSVKDGLTDKKSSCDKWERGGRQGRREETSEWTEILRKPFLFSWTRKVSIHSLSSHYPSHCSPNPTSPIGQWDAADPPNASRELEWTLDLPLDAYPLFWPWNTNVTVFIGKVRDFVKTLSNCCMQLLELQRIYIQHETAALICDTMWQKEFERSEFPRCDALENNNAGDGPQCVTLAGLKLAFRNLYLRPRGGVNES